MNDRTRTATNGTSRSTRTPGLASTARPNLFRNQLIRRPTASSSNSAETLRLDADGLSDTSEIVVRDQHGEVEIENPPTPVIDDEDECAALQDQQILEKEKQRLTDAVKHYQVSHSSVSNQPVELLDAIQASLRAKVSALAEDNWMFEPEEQTRG